MDGRKSKVTSWLNKISNELYGICNIFTHGLISKDDIGETEIFNIINNLQNILIILDDILFKLEGENTNGQSQINS